MTALPISTSVPSITSPLQQKYELYGQRIAKIAIPILLIVLASVLIASGVALGVSLAFGGTCIFSFAFRMVIPLFPTIIAAGLALSPVIDEVSSLVDGQASTEEDKTLIGTFGRYLGRKVFSWIHPKS